MAICRTSCVQLPCRGHDCALGSAVGMLCSCKGAGRSADLKGHRAPLSECLLQGQRGLGGPLSCSPAPPRTYCDSRTPPQAGLAASPWLPAVKRARFSNGRAACSTSPAGALPGWPAWKALPEAEGSIRPAEQQTAAEAPIWPPTPLLRPVRLCCCGGADSSHLACCCAAASVGLQEAWTQNFISRLWVFFSSQGSQKAPPCQTLPAAEPVKESRLARLLQRHCHVCYCTQNSPVLGR